MSAATATSCGGACACGASLKPAQCVAKRVAVCPASMRVLTSPLRVRERGGSVHAPKACGGEHNQEGSEEERVRGKLGRRALLMGCTTLVSGAIGLTGQSPPARASESQSTAQAVESRLSTTAALSHPTTLPFVKPMITEYPRWLFGEWDVSSVVVASRSAPTSAVAAALASVPLLQLGSSFQYKLKFYSTLPDSFSNQLKFAVGILPEDAIVQDRAFNTISLVNGILGSQLVEVCEYDPTDAPTLASVTLSKQVLGKKQVDVVIKSTESGALLPAESTDNDEGYLYAPQTEFVCSELSRLSDFGADYEILTHYSLQEDGLISGKQRIAVYPLSDIPGFGGDAVTVYDFQLGMRRVPAPAGATVCVETFKGVTQCI